MHIVIDHLTATALFLLAYPYFVYPVLLYIFTFTAYSRRNDQIHYNLSASIVLSVYNEEKVIGDKIKNFLAIDYPSDMLDIWIVSDGSTDFTNSICQSYVSERIKFISQGRMGKTEALNKASAAAQGDILIFTDANTFFADDAVKNLVARFSDPTVGLATGRVVPRGSTVGEGVFSKFEKLLKSLESKVGMVAGADGAIYAMRRFLFKPLPAARINDFYHPIQTLLSGYKAVFAADAIAFEESDDDLAKEFARQKRMSSQACAIVFSTIRSIFSSKKYLFLYILLSHKVFRWLHVPIFISFAIMAMLKFIIWNDAFMFGLAAAYILIFTIGYMISKNGRRKGLLYLLFKFQVVHAAYMFGIFHYFKGQTSVTWEPRGGAQG